MSSPLRDAYNAHANLAVIGLKANYGLEDAPDRAPVNRELPCIIPGYVEQNTAFSLLSVSAGQIDLTLTPTFTLFYKNVNSDVRVDVIAETLVDLMWYYALAIADNPDLDDTLAQDISYTAQFGVYEYFNEQYVGIQFTHNWEFKEG